MLVLVACAGPEGPAGPPGPQGASGAPGASGVAGTSPDGGPVTGGGTGALGGPGSNPTTTGRSGSRIKLYVTKTSTPDGFESVAASPFDQLRNEPCVPNTRSGDGVTRCLPLAIGMGATGFLDAGCTRPIYTSFLATTVPPVYVFDYVDPGNPATMRTRVFSAKQATSPTTIYRRQGPVCEAAQGFPDRPSFVGEAEINPSDFVETSRAEYLLP